MFWVIEYLNGSNASENEINFKFADKTNIKSLYFQDDLNRFGLLSDGKFFINDKQYDFKIKEPQKYIQFKTAFIIADGTNKIESWSLGFETYSKIGYEKYIMKINLDRNVYFVASKFDLSSNLIDEKTIRLQ